MIIPLSLSHDFAWWKQALTTNNNLGPLSFQLEIYTDASKTGWGACCNGKKTRGFWNGKEQNLHINYLELLAAFFGIQCFAKNLNNCNTLCRIDNTTAIAYINRMGSVQFPELNILTRKIWQWCEQRNLFLFASYIKSKDNKEADAESRFLNTDTEWELCQKHSFKLSRSSVPTPEIDLFASRINTKCRGREKEERPRMLRYRRIYH